MLARSTAPPRSAVPRLKVALAPSGIWLSDPPRRVMAGPPASAGLDALRLGPLAEAVAAARVPTVGSPAYDAELRIDARASYSQVAALFYTLGQAEIETWYLTTDDGRGGRGSIRLDAPRAGERIPPLTVARDPLGMRASLGGAELAPGCAGPAQGAKPPPAVPRRSDGSDDLAALTACARNLPHDGGGRIIYSAPRDTDFQTFVHALDALREGGFDSPLLGIQ